ncbi:ABC transporter ATP-binding protein [Mesorhizobium sp. YR577]|uniref:ABC transporter ATP-binding protein n=1 Tax=Mesorhizobium sp. YR577 TaxID=1884373 RepID=UPI0008EC70F0|nr:ABC transporter ATP-binding protein [Mesorhizobium sp. YR577]SFU22399.1 peptide/nickel transport system ATP-binding protein [Mesorhizobium sp. YR577]
MTSSTHAFVSADALLKVAGLSISAAADTPLVEDLSFEVGRGEAVAIVGESGCGKSLTSLAIMGLLPDSLDRHKRGAISFEGRDLTALPLRDMQSIRGNRMAMIFQEPLTALNPVMTVGAQIVEVLRKHRKMGKVEARERATDLLRQVRVPDPEARLDDYPHRLSGGMRQRVTIAMAMACEPSLIIADEPTTALDVTVQAQILDLLREIRERSGQSLVLITHDLGVVRQIAERMIVMYAGVVVEAGSVEDIMSSPRHPYTAGLMAARPRGSFKHDGKLLSDISGAVPAPDARPQGCLFGPRCARAAEDCLTARPPLTATADGRAHRCFYPILEVT